MKILVTIALFDDSWVVSPTWRAGELGEGIGEWGFLSNDL